MEDSAGSSIRSRWERAGQQPRSFETQDAFLASAEALFGARGVEPTSVTDVAKHASRSIGSLYHHFKNKEMLVKAVVDRILGEMDTAIANAHDASQWEALSVEGVVRRFVGRSLALDRTRPGYKRILIEVSLTDPETQDRYRNLRRRLGEGLTERLLDKRHAIGHPDPETAARFAVDQLSAMLTARLDREATPTELETRSDEEFIEEAVGSIRAYLRLRDVGG